MHVTRRKCEDYAASLGLKGHAMSDQICRVSRLIIRSRQADCLTRRRARPPNEVLWMRPRGSSISWRDESDSPEGAMTSLTSGPPLTVSGEDQPAAAEHLQYLGRLPWTPPAPGCKPQENQLDICSRRSQAVLINFVFESAHRFPRGFNANDFHRFPPASHLQFA